MLGNYLDAKKANEEALKINPDSAYANKGMGLSLGRLGELEKGIEYLRKAIALSDENFTDPYYDLAVLLMRTEGKKKLWKFLKREEKIQEFYRHKQGPL